VGKTPVGDPPGRPHGHALAVALASKAGAQAAAVVTAADPPPPECSGIAGNLVGDCGFENPSVGSAPFRLFAPGISIPNATIEQWFAETAGTQGTQAAVRG